MNPTPTTPPQPPQTLADIQAEREYQKLLAGRLRAMQQQKRLADDIARITRPQLTAEQAHARGVHQRLAELRERRQAAAEQARVEQHARAADLRARFGQRAGGFLAGAERFGRSRVGQAVAGGVTAFGAAVGGLARSGFQGTVEKNRFDEEMGRISREVGNAFRPLLDLGTRLATRVRRTLEGMSEGQQDALMYGGLAAGGFGAYRFGGMAGRMLGLGGMGAAVAGGVGTATAGAGGAAATTAGAGGAMAGTGLAARLGGLGRMAGRAGRAAPWLLPVSVGASMAGFGEQQAEQANPYTHTFASQNPEMAKLLDGKSAAERRAMLAQAEGQKPNALLRGLGSAGKWGRNAGAWALNQIPVGERIKYIDESSSADQLKRELGRRGDVGPGRRRQLTPDQFGYEETGSAYRRASVGFLSRNTGDDAGGEKSVTVLQEIAKLVGQVAANTEREAAKPKAEVQ